MSWTTYTVNNFADDLHWPELGILLESIYYHEAARKASFLGSMCGDPLMAAIHFKEDLTLWWNILLTEHPIGKVKDFFYRVEFKLEVVAVTWKPYIFSGLKIYPRISVVTLVMFQFNILILFLRQTS